MSKKKKEVKELISIDEAFDHLINEKWYELDREFTFKYKSCKSKHLKGKLKVSHEKKKEMLAEAGYEIFTELTFLNPAK